MLDAQKLTYQQVCTICFSPTRSIALQIPRALVVSAFAAGIDVLGLVLLKEMAGWRPLYAAVLSYLLGGIIQYVLCSLWVFSTVPGNAPFSFVVFTVLSLIGLGITFGVIWLLNEHWHMNYLLAKFAALGLAFCWNFTSRKYLIFGEKQMHRQ